MEGSSVLTNREGEVEEQGEVDRLQHIRELAYTVSLNAGPVMGSELYTIKGQLLPDEFKQKISAGFF